MACINEVVECVREKVQNGKEMKVVAKLLLSSLDPYEWVHVCKYACGCVQSTHYSIFVIFLHLQ